MALGNMPVPVIFGLFVDRVMCCDAVSSDRRIERYSRT